MILVGGGFGPLIAGAMSDAMSSLYGGDSLRHALTVLLLFLVPAAAAFFWCGRAMPQAD